jgi:two-component system, NtrC family, sensor kinase
MRRRAKAGGGPGKPGRGKSVAVRRRPVASAKTARNRAVSAARHASELQRLKRERKDIADQQHATAEVLQLISESSGDLQPVFASILESAVRLCEAHNGVINRWDGDALHLAATHNMPEAFIAVRKSSPYRPEENSATGRLLARKGLIHIADLAEDPAYLAGNPSTVAAVNLGGVRTTLAVPLLKDNALVGSFTVGRRVVRPFTSKQIKIVRNFAAQAVVAIDNARLLHQLQETLQQQAAAADVLKIMSRSTYDLQPVLDTLIELVARQCGADLAAIHPERSYFSAYSIYGGPESHKEVAGSVAFEPGGGSVMARTAREGRPVQVADVLADPDYTLHEVQQRLGYRTVLGVPLLREGRPVGIIVLMRSTVRPFTQQQIVLAQNFADQAVIAIENTRLLTELRWRTDELIRSVAELERERNNKLMNLEAMVASISHEVRQPLASIASNGGAALRFLGHAPPNIGEVRQALNRMVNDSHRASQVFDNIRALFGSADRGYEPIDVNELVRGVLGSLQSELDDHGIDAAHDLASELPPITGHRGQLQEVLVNLIRNAIDAMHGDESNRRILQLRTGPHGGNRIFVAVEDSGPGIDPARLESIFDAFVTTKAQGMGLGLALSRMIIDRHAGQLSAVPAEPRGSIFRIVLPSGTRPGSDANP